MIFLEPYQEKWKELFSNEKKLLQEIFLSVSIDFHHIGSTSISGCFAKPVVDILGVTADVGKIDILNEKMEKEGYQPLGEYGMKQRRFFKKRGFHLHIFEDSDPECTRHMRFANYLRSHPEAVKEYSELKLSLAKRYPDSIQDYILGKEKWIKGIDFKAALEKLEPRFYPSLGPRKNKWKNDEIVHALHVNLHLHMSYFAKYLPHIELVFQPDVTVIRSPIQNDILNYVLSAHFTEKNVSERVKHVISTYKEKKLPFSWWVSESEDTPASLTRELLRQGLTPKEKGTGMFLEIGSRDWKKEEGDFVRVTSSQILADFAEIVASVGGALEMYHEVYQQLPSILYEEGASCEMYVLYHENIPVTTGIAVFHAQVIGIYYIATRALFRRRGFGTKMMHYLLWRAKVKGYSLATLQASEEGKTLYERLDFKSCCRFMEYSHQGTKKRKKNEQHIRGK